MRKVSYAIAIGLVLAACGGGEDKEPPKTPATPAATTPPAPAPTTVEAPKKEEPKLTLAELQQKALKGMNEATNAHDAKKLAGFYSEGAIVKIAGAPQEVSGREAIAQSYQKLFDAFSNYKTAPSRVWTKGDVVIVEWAFNGTHTGDLWGIKGTEKPVGAQGVDAIWFTPEGLVKEHHVYYDGGTILSQIGVSKQKSRGIPQLAATPQTFNAGGADEQKNVDAVKAMDAALEGKKEADFLGALSDNVEFDDASQPVTSKGKADAKKFYKELTTGFPDTKYNHTNSWGIGDYVITESTWTGTHKGSFFGIPATKKSISVKTLDIAQFKDGKYVHGWNYSNGADFAQQLGLAPQPGGDKKGAAPAAADKKDPKAGATPAPKGTTAPAPAPAPAPKK